MRTDKAKVKSPKKKRPITGLKKYKDVPARKNEVYLGYQTGADLGVVERSRSGAGPYSTRLTSNSMHMQVCCKCFGRTGAGMCAGHAAEQHSRLFFAELVLKLVAEKVEKVYEAMTRPHEGGLNIPLDLMEAIDNLLKFRSLPPEDRHPCDEKDQPARKAKHAAEKAAKEAAEATKVPEATA